MECRPMMNHVHYYPGASPGMSGGKGGHSDTGDKRRNVQHEKTEKSTTEMSPWPGSNRCCSAPRSRGLCHNCLSPVSIQVDHLWKSSRSRSCRGPWVPGPLLPRPRRDGTTCGPLMDPGERVKPSRGSVVRATSVGSSSTSPPDKIWSGRGVAKTTENNESMEITRTMYYRAIGRGGTDQLFYVVQRFWLNMTVFSQYLDGTNGPKSSTANRRKYVVYTVQSIGGDTCKLAVNPWDRAHTQMRGDTCITPPSRACSSSRASAEESWGEKRTVVSTNKTCLLYTSPSPRD